MKSTKPGGSQTAWQGQSPDFSFAKAYPFGAKEVSLSQRHRKEQKAEADEQICEMGRAMHRLVRGAVRTHRSFLGLARYTGRRRDEMVFLCQSVLELTSMQRKTKPYKGKSIHPS